MFMLDLFAWWYGAGWKGVLQATARRLSGLGEMFSTKILMRTLFAPWRRIVTNPGAGLDAHMRASLDNLVSRFIGFTVRFFVLLAAGVALICLLVAGFLELIVWPLVPILAVGLIAKGFL